LLNYQRLHARQKKIDLPKLKGFLKSIYIIGIVNKGRGEYWKFMFWTLFHRPNLFVDAVTFAVYGYHFRAVYGLSDKRRD
jgi:hypothetical protein